MHKKKVVLLGSTGSIGTQTLEVIKDNQDRFEIEALSCNQNIELLKKQIKEFRPKRASIADLSKSNLKINEEIEMFWGEEGTLELLKKSEAEVVVVAISGAKGLLPTIEAIRLGKNVALATKEVMVLAGELIKKELKLKNEELKKEGKPAISLLPIDSEHNAIWQCLRAGSKSEVEKIILTCSGGPFREFNQEQLEKVTPQQALNHPNWHMGQRITIDCATLLNKGLELIEAKWLFDVDISQIEVVVHPESVIHSGVQYVDGSIISQMGPKNMELPIQYALTYPERISGNYQRLSLTDLGKMTFYKPDLDKFPCLQYAMEAIEKGGTMPTVLNAVDEIVVDLFLNEKIKFLEIPKIIKQIMSQHKVISSPTLTDILAADSWARKEALNYENY